MGTTTGLPTGATVVCQKEELSTHWSSLDLSYSHTRSLGVKPICTEITNKAGLVDCVTEGEDYTPLMGGSSTDELDMASGVAPDNCNAVPPHACASLSLVLALARVLSLSLSPSCAQAADWGGTRVYGSLGCDFRAADPNGPNIVRRGMAFEQLSSSASSMVGGILAPSSSSFVSPIR